MNPETRNAAIEHCLASYPREACGLIIIDHDGVESYVPCKNTAVSKSEHFRIDPAEYAEVEDRGQVIAVVHSHPDYPATPSEGDRVSCEASGLPWYIFAVHREPADGSISIADEYGWAPDGYEAPLVGRHFAYGVLDCLTLIKDWYKRERGIILPEIEHRDGWWNSGQSLYLDYFAEFGFEPARGPLQVGDVILMQIRSPEPNHGGIYIGDGIMLHHLYNRLSSREVYGGYWAEKTILVVRRKKDASTN